MNACHNFFVATLNSPSRSAGYWGGRCIHTAHQQAFTHPRIRLSKQHSRLHQTKKSGLADALVPCCWIHHPLHAASIVDSSSFSQRTGEGVQRIDFVIGIFVLLLVEEGVSVHSRGGPSGRLDCENAVERLALIDHLGCCCCCCCCRHARLDLLAVASPAHMP